MGRLRPSFAEVAGRSDAAAGTVRLPVHRRRGALGCTGGPAGSPVARRRARAVHRNHAHGRLHHDRQGRQHLDRARHRSVRQAGHGGGEGGGVRQGGPLHHQVDGNRQGGPPPWQVQVRRVRYLVVVLREPGAREVGSGGWPVVAGLGHTHLHLGCEAILRLQKAGSPAQNDPGPVHDPALGDRNVCGAGRLDRDSGGDALTWHHHRVPGSTAQFPLHLQPARRGDGVGELPFLQQQVEVGLGSIPRSCDRRAQQHETSDQIRHGPPRSAEVELLDDFPDESLQLSERRRGFGSHVLPQQRGKRAQARIQAREERHFGIPVPSCVPQLVAIAAAPDAHPPGRLRPLQPQPPAGPALVGRAEPRTLSGGIHLHMVGFTLSDASTVCTQHPPRP